MGFLTILVNVLLGASGLAAVVGLGFGVFYGLGAVRRGITNRRLDNEQARSPRQSSSYDGRYGDAAPASPGGQPAGNGAAEAAKAGLIAQAQSAGGSMSRGAIGNGG
jgi:hypothetical protein